MIPSLLFPTSTSSGVGAVSSLPPLTRTRSSFVFVHTFFRTGYPIDLSCKPYAMQVTLRPAKASTLRVFQHTRILSIRPDMVADPRRPASVAARQILQQKQGTSAHLVVLEEIFDHVHRALPVVPHQILAWHNHR